MDKTVVKISHMRKTLHHPFISSCYFNDSQYFSAVANGGNKFSKGDLIMRKVLLATTALVAVGGITAANADISISGNYEWEYMTDDAGTSYWSRRQRRCNQSHKRC